MPISFRRSSRPQRALPQAKMAARAGTLFISHGSKDAAAADVFRQRLAEQGYQSLFLDFDPQL
jgi:hypothetical protein